MKQTTISYSLAKTEYCFVATIACKLIWLHTLLHNLLVPISSSTQLYYDNHAGNLVHHEHTKHIEINCSFIQDCIEFGSITISYISSNLQVSYIFTKALGSHQFLPLVGKSGILSLQALTQGGILEYLFAIFNILDVRIDLH